MSEALYNELIVAEAKTPHGAGRLAAPTASARADNPLCGDRVTFEVAVEDGRIIDAAHETRGCLLTRAAASLVSRHCEQASAADVAAWRAKIEAVLAGGEAKDWPELAMFKPVARVKSRHECVLLPFKAVEDALRKLVPDQGVNACSRSRLETLDREDPLRHWRDRFDLPDGIVYLDGNSLGAQPRETLAAVPSLIREQWGRDLITSWNRHDWIGLPQRVADSIARIIGAASREVAVCDSISVNLFKLLAAALPLVPGHRVILAERGNFPTDLYVAQGLARLLDGRIELRLVDGPADILPALDRDVAVLMVTHVDYRTGRMHDMVQLTMAAHEAGALMLWDLAHSAGAMPLALTACGVDLAVGCGYKYLNGGPGAPAFLYVAERHQERMHQPLAGWMGHGRPFAFVPDYEPAPGIDRFLAGTPPIIAMEALRIGAAMLAEADMEAIRAKSVAMGEAMIALADQHLAGYGFRVVSPRDARARGSQVSLAHAQGYAIMQAMIARRVIGDFRAPDILRFGFTPLYARYTDVADAIDALVAVMEERAWADPRFQTRVRVT